MSDGQRQEYSERDRHRERSFGQGRKPAWRYRPRGQPCHNARGKLPFHEQRPDFRDAQITVVAFTLAHDVEQDRKFGVHHETIPRTPVSFAAREIRIHVGCNLPGVQSAFGAAVRVRVVRTEGCEALDLRFVDLTVDGEDA